MDSPSDLSPNAPPLGFDDPFKNIPENAGQSHQGTASTEGSVDSSGFEKVDHDVLEEYGHNFAQQMQQSIFGQLPDDPDGHDDDFVIVSGTMDELPGVELLKRIPAEIDKPYPSNLEDEISPRHTASVDKEVTPSPAPRSKETSPEPEQQYESHHHEERPHEEHHNHEPEQHVETAAHQDEVHIPHQQEESPAYERQQEEKPHNEAEVAHLVESHNPELQQESPEYYSRYDEPYVVNHPVLHRRPHHHHHPHPEHREPQMDHHDDHRHTTEHPEPPAEQEIEQNHVSSFAMEHRPPHHDDHHVPQDDTGDLIDIPSNDSPVLELDYGAPGPRPASPLIPEPVSHHLPEHYDLPEPVVHEELSEPRVIRFPADLEELGTQARHLVEEAVHEARDKIFRGEEDYGEDAHVSGDETNHHIEPVHREPSPVHHHVEPVHREPSPVQQHVESVHHEVDDVLESMNDNDDFQKVVKAKTREEEPEPEPDFRRTPEPEERPHERHGPLTIPELPDQQEEEPELLEDIPAPPAYDFGHRHGFETEPRPPTPPKDISDEDVKPSLVNLGHGHVTHAHTESSHSILKHASSNVEPWCDFKHVDPCLLDLVYWRDPKKSAIALSLSLLAVFVIAKYPLLSIISYTGLAILAGTLGFRLFKAIEGQIKKTGGENPFQDYLNKDLHLPQEKVHSQVDVLVEHGVCLANKAKKLIFVENIFETVKFVLTLWAMTYVSAWFSGFGLVILTILGLFTVPKVYETYQEPIDQQWDVIKGHINNVQQLVEDKLPFLKRATAEAEKKEQ